MNIILNIHNNICILINMKIIFAIAACSIKATCLQKFIFKKIICCKNDCQTSFYKNDVQNDAFPSCWYVLLFTRRQTTLLLRFDFCNIKNSRCDVLVCWFISSIISYDMGVLFIQSKINTKKLLYFKNLPSINQVLSVIYSEVKAWPH